MRNQIATRKGRPRNSGVDHRLEMARRVDPVVDGALGSVGCAGEHGEVVSSYKGSTLEVGERSGLIIGSSGAEYTVTSSNPFASNTIPN